MTFASASQFHVGAFSVIIKLQFSRRFVSSYSDLAIVAGTVETVETGARSCSFSVVVARPVSPHHRPRTRHTHEHTNTHEAGQLFAETLTRWSRVATNPFYCQNWFCQIKLLMEIVVKGGKFLANSFQTFYPRNLKSYIIQLYATEKWKFDAKCICIPSYEMSTKVIKDGNVTTTIMDLTNGVGGRSAEVRTLCKIQTSMNFKWKFSSNVSVVFKLVHLFTEDCNQTSSEQSVPNHHKCELLTAGPRNFWSFNVYHVSLLYFLLHFTII